MVAELKSIQTIVCAVGKLTHIGPDDNLYESGLSSLHALELLLELETNCDVSVPDEKFIAARTPRALHTLIHDLQQGL